MNQDFNLGSILENAPQMITLVDPDGTIRYLNRTESGFHHDLFIGKKIYDFIDPEFHPAVQEALERAASTGVPHTYINSARVNELTSWYENRVSAVEPGCPEKGMMIFSTNITERRETENALRESEDRYRKLVEESPDTIVIHCEGKIAYINQAGLRLLELTHAEEVIGRSAIEFVYPEDRERVGRRIMEALKNGTVAPMTMERFLLPSGKLMDVEVTGIPHAYMGKPAMQVIIRDVTHRLRIEKSVKESEARLAAFMEFIPALILIKDHELRPVFANKRLARYFPVTEWMGKKPHELFPREVADLMVEKDTEALTSGHTSYEETWVDKEGKSHVYLTEKFRIDIPDSSPLVGSIITDITDKKNAEYSMRETEEIFSQFMNRSPVYVFFKDEQIRSLRLSRNFEKMLGRPLEELLGKTMDDLFPSEFAKQMVADDKKVLLEGIEVVIGEEFNGRSYRTIKFPIHIDGKPRFLAGYTIDITEQKQAEEELVRAREKAEQSDRLKSAFLANMSHEIRTPMNAIVGFAEMLSDPDISQQSRSRFSAIIQSRSDDLMHIINDLLEISRIESGNVSVIRERIDLNPLIDDLEAVYLKKLQQSGKSISLKSVHPLPSDKATLLSDGYIIRQVFVNLLDNAIKYTPQGEILFGYDPPANGLLSCFVTDTGMGISPENHEVIFEHFRQAEMENQHRFGGTGLGLSICRGSLALLGGTIRVDSEPGKGSTFRFTIPWEQSEPEPGEPKSKPGPAKTSLTYDWSGKRILMVEDEEANMEFLTVILGGTGAELVPAFNGREVREFFPSLGSFDVVLMDVRLPDASGWDLAAEIKSLRPDLPVIAQTAFAMSSDRQKSEESGCNGYISKPLRKENLLKLISEYIQP